MDLNSILFLTVFLPLILGIYFLLYRFTKRKNLYTNIVLLIGSFAFYIFNGSLIHFGILVGVTGLHFLLCLLIAKYNLEDKNKVSKIILIIDLVISVGLLVFFKYINLVANTSLLFPLGLSFITFHSISFTVDTYKNKINPKNIGIFRYFLYIFLFFKLLEGPIVTFEKIENKSPTMDKFYNGIIRFCIGLAKKVLIADIIAVSLLSITSRINVVGTGFAWLAVLFYTVQLFFDFSGYCDMAVGIGLMFGYDLPENFSDPYLSTSIRDFWRRWHITLGAWFREYVYIPLGGNRKGKTRTIINLFIIFVLTGLWHGSTLNFLLWGLFHGIFIVLERLFLGKYLDKNKFKVINIVYSLFVVMMGWVLFMSPNLSTAGVFYKNLFSPQSNVSDLTASLIFNYKVIIALSAGLIAIFAVPLLRKYLPKVFESNAWQIFKACACIVLLVVCFVFITNSSYLPSIYGGF